MRRVGFALLLLWGASQAAAQDRIELSADKKNGGGVYLDAFKEKLTKLLQKEREGRGKPTKDDGNKAAQGAVNSDAVNLSDLFLFNGSEEKKSSKQEEPAYRWSPASFEEKAAEDHQAAKEKSDDGVRLVIESGQKLCSELNLTAVHALIDAKEPQNGKTKLQPGGGKGGDEKAKAQNHPKVMEHLMVLTGIPSNCLMEDKEIGELKKVLENVKSSKGSSRRISDDHKSQKGFADDYDYGASPFSVSGMKPYSECMAESGSRNAVASRRHLKETTTSGDSLSGDSGDSTTSGDSNTDDTTTTDGGAYPSAGKKPAYSSCLRVLGPANGSQQLKASAGNGRKLKKSTTSDSKSNSPTSNSPTSNSPSTSDDYKAQKNKKSKKSKKSKRSRKNKKLLRVLAATDRLSSIDALQQLFGLLPDSLGHAADDAELSGVAKGVETDDKGNGGASNDAEADVKKDGTATEAGGDAGGKKTAKSDENHHGSGEVSDQMVNQLDLPTEKHKDVGGSGARPAEKLTKLTEQKEASDDVETPGKKETKKRSDKDKKKKKAGAVEKCQLFALHRNEKGLVVDVDPKCAHEIDTFDWNGISKLLDSMVLPSASAT